jgi:hypothetical protein
MVVGLFASCVWMFVHVFEINENINPILKKESEA